MDNLMMREARTAADYIIKAFNIPMPSVAVILGSGLGEFTKMVKIVASIKYADIPGFFNTAVEGHAGSLSIAKLDNGKLALIMEGRFHFYEGYTPQQVAFPVSVFSVLGIKHLIVSNAAGAINPNFKAGDLMIINDHINLTGNHPLIGKNDSKVGPRFLDLTEPYCSELISLAEKTAKKLNIVPKLGTYLGLSGPTYETKAEIKALGILGADAVGMSTIYEVIMANYFKIKVLGISGLTNMATGLTTSKHDHAEVMHVANQISSKFSRWVKEIIQAL